MAAKDAAISTDDRAQPAGRLHYIDSIRVALSVLVILHHAAQPYGPMDWWYVEGQPKVRWIEDFAVLNAPFKMSLFFLIAAYFLPPAVDRRHERPFVGPRLKKLGGPILVGFFLLIPVLMFAYYVNFRDYGPIGFGDYYSNIYFGQGKQPPDWTGPTWPDRQLGHLWFIQHLLLYSLLYLAWRAVADWLRRRRGASAAPGIRAGPPIGGREVVVFACVVALGTALLRIRYPVDEWIALAGVIQIEPADFAQHLPFVIAGVMAYRRGWMQTLPAPVAYGWLFAAVVLSVVFLAFRDDLSGYFKWGGLNLGQFSWAAYETVLCIGYALGMLVIFRDHARGTSKLARAAADSTFAIYLVHLPIVVAMQYAVSGSSLTASGRFLVVSGLAVLLSVATALLLRRIPLIRSIL